MLYLLHVSFKLDPNRKDTKMVKSEISDMEDNSSKGSSNPPSPMIEVVDDQVSLSSTCLRKAVTSKDTKSAKKDNQVKQLFALSRSSRHKSCA